MIPSFHIDPDIRKAETLPASFYRDPEVYQALKEKVFYQSWQCIGDSGMLGDPGSATPLMLLEGFLDEPLVLTRDAGGNPYCLSNVCTHRGNLVVEESGPARKLVCGYHGRRFGLDGSFEHMPEFEQTKDFPSPCDHLAQLPLRQWGPFLFAGLDPAFEIGPVLEAMEARIGFLPLDQLRPDPSRTQVYDVKAHWALYCDNFLEGFHIPFVHKALDAVLDYGDYETVLFEHCNLQIGYADGEQEVFALPEKHPDAGRQVAAYYFLLFPNTMFNFYPWGVSVNWVHPLGPDHTRVTFKSFVWDASKLDRGAGSGLDRVELEDEAVVEGVHKGLQSRFYRAGRFSPTREQGVHHFHRLLAEFLMR
ncbi:aromatic ring-hydroxylating dioxygenase subunit alpha [Robiginitalea sp. M366]|uniref:aromatic ring-hydroxylating oxygenase subunit alpha n=1 Tax=Robiginitalea aestuariiviva TaxID=3036903 RepID=UPI00240D7EEB|nr:aromatic ring-hydroxylating dioxygenase subunit alpha [Robiginitalea aestuariiviva]MDG1571130.1 aromatic ring-hydroxylating dioxygenase subunit alpha [Robiginitalea aestuariiviva]